MYEDKIRKYHPLTIEHIIQMAEADLPLKYRSMPWTYQDEAGRNLERGTAILETEELCSAYMAAYGRMHCHKLNYALDKSQGKGNFPYGEVRNGVEIFDWGCGQGLGSLAVIENLRREGLLSCLKKITLEEPSDIARERALLHVKQALDDDSCTVVETCSEYLPSDDASIRAIQSINVEQPCVIHILSNVLDIESVSLKGISKLITSSGARHIVLCVGPANLNESRINAFKNYFRDNGIRVFTDFRETYFGKHSNGKAYGCLIKSFIFSLKSQESILHKYNCFAPLQFFACYAETMPEKRISNEGAFEIMAPFDMTVRRGLNPVFALVSNLISRGIPTYASERITTALMQREQTEREKALKVIARIQKTIIEALITGRIDRLSEEWKILIIDDCTNIANIAVEDFAELYGNLIAMTEKYDGMLLPKVSVVDVRSAAPDEVYDMVIDVSVDKFADPEHVAFSKYRAKNDCYFIVRSSESVYEPRILYTTERIEYKSLAKKEPSGKYIQNETTVSHLRYFLQLIFRKQDFRPGQLPILNRALRLKSVIGLLPTGGGKSLTYQLAAMLQPGVTLVVDPLKGLMKDQYDGLLKTGIDCISYINSDVTMYHEEAHRREQALTGSQIQIMFLSPERLSIYRFREVLRSMRESNVYFAYGVIDEVHCVSEWGHDFRLAYLHLGRNLYNYVLPKEVEGTDNHISLFGLTATASFDVLADVERELSGSNSYSLEDDATVRFENTNRLELQYNVYPIDATNASKAWEVGDLKETALIDALRRKNNLKRRAMNKNLIEKIAPQLTELMIKKMETLTEAWRKPWIADLAHGLPRNLRGTPYRGGNILMLLFLSEIAGYSTPLFMTFKQAKEEGLNILKGSGSFPVFFWKLYIRHKETRKKIELADYYRLPQEQRRQYDVLPVMRYYPVFNIDQTDMSEQQPERYTSLTTPTGPKDYSDGLTCEVLDRMLAEQSWLCPILLRSGNRASYSPTLDRIVCPEKRQFPEGAAFYTTLLHEVTHSTGHAKRLNRPFGACYGDADYIREELVAELTAALCGAMLGFATTPREESAAYIKDWLAEFHKEPTYLFDILTDVNRAARMISERLACEQEPETPGAIPAEAA